ncbi:hypothetical protein OBBRIDRAFT_793339 [Obba rivulosa]|uniref:DUF6533 domain-containing protein n=1 Tax=Obba rivulosa TaxID=1052685 RepID=A0A8E2DKW3_9APHY|nr:hypothetical protein OBBRIDRAFT_793339 [Obba rivulosa]
MSGLSLAEMYILDIGKRSRISAITLLGYDYFISLSDEVDVVWSQNKRRPMFWMHTFNRLFALLYLIFDSIPLTPSGIVSSKSCIIYLMCDDIVTLVTTITVQAILQLRVYALYHRSRRMLWFLLTMSAIEVSVMVILIGVTISRIERLPVISTPTGCEYTGIFALSALFWLPGLVYEPILLLLVVHKAWPLSKSAPRVPMIIRMARDSLLYFTLVFVELLVSTVIWAHFPKYINIIMPWSAALPSVLGSRMLLNTREAAYKKESTLEFSSFSFGGTAHSSSTSSDFPESRSQSTS